MKKSIFCKMLVAMAFGVIPATAQTGSGTGSPALPATQPVGQDPVAAGGADAVAETADGKALSRKQKRTLRQQAEGELKFSLAKHALESRNCVIAIYDSRSTSKTRASYNYIEIQGDSIVMQAAWPGSPAAAYRSGGGYARSEGTISRFEMTPDKKGNIDVKIDAAMRVVSFGISYGGWPLHMRFKLFQGSNLVPLIAGLQGYVMLPSQVNKMQLNGPSFRFY